MIINFINPALTTMPMQNPSFRVYEMNSENFNIIDFIDYRLNLTKSNQQRKAFWYKSLRFTEFFNISELNPQNLNLLLQNALNGNIKIWEKLMKIRFQEGSMASYILKNPRIFLIAKMGRNLGKN